MATKKVESDSTSTNESKSDTNGGSGSGGNGSDENGHRKGTWHEWFHRYNVQLTLLCMVIPIVVSILSIWMSWTNSSQQHDLETKQTLLTNQMALQARSKNLIAVLDMVSRSSADLGGWATTSASGGSSPKVRRPSAEALQGYSRPPAEWNGKETSVPYEDSAKGVIEEFELRTVPINSFQSITKVLAKEPLLSDFNQVDNEGGAKDGQNAQHIDLITDYIAPLIYPKCQSDDPAVAASALIVCSLLIEKEEDRNSTINQAQALRGANFAKVRLNWNNLDLSGLDLRRAQFPKAHISNAKLSNALLAGASFYHAILEGISFEGVRCSAINENEAINILRESPDRQSVLLAAHFTGHKCADFSNAEFKTCKIKNAKGKDAKGKDAKGKDAKGKDAGPISMADFTMCRFDNATIGDGCVVNYVRFLGSSLMGVKAKSRTFQNSDFRWCLIGSLAGSGSFENSQFVNCKFDNCNFTSAMLTGASFDRGSFDNASIIGSTLLDNKFKDIQMNGVLFDGGSIGGTSFENCTGHVAVFKSSASAPVVFKGGDFTGSSFSSMKPNEFNAIQFENGVVLNWSRIPYSAELEKMAKAKTLKYLAPGNAILSKDSMLIVVEPKGDRYEYRGALIYKDGDAAFTWNAGDDRGSSLISYLRNRTTDALLQRLRLERKEIPKIEKRRATDQEIENVRAYLGKEWKVDFPAPSSATGK